MSKPDPLEEMASRYRQDGWEVKVRPRLEELPPFFASSAVDLLAFKGGEYRAVHPAPTNGTTTTTPPPVSAGREPDLIHMRTLLAEAERFLRAGALEASLLLAWSVTEAALREAVRPPGAAFIRPPMPRDLIQEGFRRRTLTSQDAAVLDSSWNLRSMVSHGLRPDELPPETVQEVIGIARRLTAAPTTETGEAITDGLKAVKYGYGVRQSGELLTLVSASSRVLSEVIGPSAGLVSAEWDRTEDTKGRSIVTLRLSDFTGAVTGTFAIDDLRSYPILRNRLHRLWGDLLQVRNHRQLQELGAGHSVKGE